MIFKNFILIVSLTIFISTTCKKKQPPPYVPMTQEFKDYIYFKEGTYWVYKDSINGALDSILVLNDTIKFKPWAGIIKGGVAEVEFYAETFEYDVKSFYDDTIYKYNGGVITSNADNNCACQDAHKGSERIFLYKLNVGQKQNSIKLTSVYDSLKLKNKYFYDVSRFVITDGFASSIPIKVFYISKNQGIIKREIKISTNEWQIWNLIRYKIIQ